MNYNNFDWGTSSDFFISSVSDEIFERRIYEKFFEVENNDIVLDIGSSVGPFTFSILQKKPKHVYCFEPSLEEFMFLIKNTNHATVTCINKAISNVDGISENVNIFGRENKLNSCYSTTFSKFISDYNIQKIDFLKTDCEGGEYSIFTKENIDWILKNVKKISGEWHLENEEQKNNFRNFRDTYLNYFNNFYVYSVDLVDIKWSLWTDEFIEYYNQVLIYIDNR